jgi:hypothetical protein
VEKSPSLSQPTSGWMCVIGPSGQAFSSQSEAPIPVLLLAHAAASRDMILHPHLAWMPLKRKAKARGKRAPRAPSILGSFCRLPELPSVGGRVAPEECHLARVAARALLSAMGEDAQHGGTLATTPDGRASVRQAWTSPTCDEPELRRAFRTVSGARSMKALFSRPERPIRSLEALRAASVKRRITCVTRTNLRRRELFFP